jgi:hypothetical protein
VSTLLPKILSQITYISYCYRYYGAGSRLYMLANTVRGFVFLRTRTQQRNV